MELAFLHQIISNPNTERYKQSIKLIGLEGFPEGLYALQVIVDSGNK